MKGEIVNQFPLVLGGTGLECPEPVADPFLSQGFTTLRREDVGPISISTGFQILIERLARLVHEVDIAPFPVIIANVQPANFRVNMCMGHLQPGDVTDQASYPVAECEDGSATMVSLLLD